MTPEANRAPRTGNGWNGFLNEALVELGIPVLLFAIHFLSPVLRPSVAVGVMVAVVFGSIWLSQELVDGWRAIDSYSKNRFDH